ncbi:Triacylglycerol lipase [Handroanthus impetiginosus]|uniref:Triacylglycerol lipase n=1 Tax=Handroanthus impetiginosus TaxID=429701 RepID=A0A2G9FXY5_9LAMI|nr:Triacylglycerol lipase [Handroanthus impetiginosus]
MAKANYEPYGMNFIKGPTGRFTNGRTTADFIAEYLGLPYAPPYMGSQGLEQLTGLNFASASCGILPETGYNLGKCLNLAEQVDYFERVVQQELPKHFQSPDELSNYLSKSVFIISIGSNDYINNYLHVPQYNTSTRYTPDSFAQLLVGNLSQQFQRLYQLGARKLVMFELGPIGCIPSNTRLYNPTGRCIEQLNRLTLTFNTQLAQMLRNLESTLQGSNFVLAQSYQLAYDAMINPSKYGFSDTTNPCCATWFNVPSGCVPAPGVQACPHPEDHFFWDGVHLTETVYETVASSCFNGSSFCVPKNIQELVLQ